MVQLVTQKQIEDRMATGFIPGSGPMFESAALAASLRMEAELETKFDKGDGEDYFLLDDSQFGVAPNYFIRLKLKNGFIRDDTPVVAMVGSTVDGCTEEVVGLQVDRDKGHVSVPAAYRNKYCKVTYSYGFEAGEEVPAALTEAVLAYIPVVADFSAVGGEKKKTNEATEAAASHALAVLTPYRRRKPFLLSPIF